MKIKKQTHSWKLKLINSLGLRNILLSKYVFRPPNPAQYVLEYQDGQFNFTPIVNGQRREICNPDIIVTASVLKENNTLFVPLIQIQRNPRRTKSSQTIPSLQADLFSIQASIDLENQFIQHELNQKRLLVIFSHGNASDLGDVFYFAERIVMEYNIDFIAYDYTGYGYGVGRYVPQEKQSYQDLQAVLSYAVHTLHYKLNQIILWGFSLGSGPTTEIGSRYTSLGGVLLQAPLASLYQWFGDTDHQYDTRDVYQNINKIQAIESKILIIHGENDRIIDIRHSELLYEKYTATRSEKNIQFLKIRDAGHNNLQQLIENGDEIIAIKIERFFKEILYSTSEANRKEEELLKLMQVNLYEPFTQNYRSQLGSIESSSDKCKQIQPKKLRLGLCICQD